MFGCNSIKEVYFGTATNRRLPGASWSIIAPPFIAVLLRPLPFPDSQSIVTVDHVPPPAAFPGMTRFSVSAANYLDWRKQNDVFESIAVWGGRGLRIAGGDRPQLMVVTSSDAD